MFVTLVVINAAHRPATGTDVAAAADVLLYFYVLRTAVFWVSPHFVGTRESFEYRPLARYDV